MNRIYAITSKNRVITSFFGLITISQFSLGLYVVVDAAGRGCESATECAQIHPAYLTVSASPILPIPLPAYMMCNYVGRLSAIIGFITMSLAYGTEPLLSFVNNLEDTRSDHLPDILAFLVVIYLVVRFKLNGVPIPSIFKIITRDTTYYFLVMFTSHLLVTFLAFARVSTSS